MMSVVSRAVGVHRLLILNFYPFLQKYIQPHQRDVTHVLAALVQVRAWGQCNATCQITGIFDQLPDQLCRLLDRLSHHLALHCRGLGCSLSGCGELGLWGLPGVS